MKRFVIADTHFFHNNIIRYEGRPFKDLDHMHSVIIQRWNATVTDSDIIYHLGDVSFAGMERTRSVLSQLRGQKILIMGNHDRGRTVGFWLKCGFEEVHKSPFKHNGYILSHEPENYRGLHVLNIHGHVHSIDKNHHKFEGYRDFHFNVSVEMINYTPQDLDRLVARWKTAELNTLRGGIDESRY